ncbi:zinc ribbon domain-containing protein [Bdellovibrio sp. HCB337]|uniref:zinc ribbon domain-containing protein n=1 Tax=Bdellovibrio sp. HCB337 TaxID=3394358 RepID=UPI0039A3FEB0
MKVKNCECCYMPMDKDPKNSGSDKYCSYCFVNGKLIAENMTLKEFKKQSFDGMVQGGMSRFKAWVFSQFIGMAPYWKNRKA